MTLLAAYALIWIAVHVGVAGSGLRPILVDALHGEKWFRLAYSIVSLGALIALVNAYKTAPYVALWTSDGSSVLGQSLPWLFLALMLAAFMLFAGSVMSKNPTAVGGEAAAAVPVRGIFVLTRHPMLWSFAIWAGVHVAANGDLASLLFFGSFLVTALVGMPSIDAKIAARDPAAWATLSANTSILPGAAILGGRSRARIADIGWAAPVVGLLAWAAFAVAHRWIIGVSVLAG